MSAGRTILIVDDDALLRHSLAEQLQLHEEFSTREAGSGAEALDDVRAHHCDAVLLDVGLPDMDGRELCRLMRRNGVRAPILMLTAADGEADTILGLDSGANDYITKPFRLNVLLARLRSQLRQHEQSEDAVFTIGPYSFRPGAKLLVDEGARKKVRLTEKETAILKYLYRAGRAHHRPRRAVERGVGLQFGRHDAHARDARLSPPAEDRAQSREGRASRHRAGRIPPRAVAHAASVPCAAFGA